MLAAAVALTAFAVFGRGRTQSTFPVMVAGRTELVSEGTTLAQAAARLGLEPKSGDLLDVQGKVLRAAAYPGRILLDGRTAVGTVELQQGDRIKVVDGLDQRESVVRSTVRVTAGRPSNPQYVLDRVPGTETITRGKISHKLVSTVFRPDEAKRRVERAVALTFDDGPSATYTPRILSALRRLHVRATFFVVGYLAAQYPALVKSELAAGMTVGNHSYNHPAVPPFGDLPPRLIDDEIALGATSLARLGIETRLFRPPGGGVSPAVVRAAAARGERVVLWSVDPGDWRPGVTAKEIAQAVLSAVRPGSIVILHDGGGDRAATAAALPTIVKGLRHRHLPLVAIAP